MTSVSGVRMVTVGGGEAVERGVEEEEEEEEREGVQPSQQDDRLQWGEASRLLFQPGYLKVLKSMALSGQLQQYNIRSVVWRLFLHVLPDDQLLWETATLTSRNNYDRIKRMHVMDPHEVTASLDVTLNNPLSQSEESPWNRFFQDNELRQLVSQDVVRTFPDVQFFRQDHIQRMMEDMLFCYVRENPRLGYRQGMHELLAPILFVMHVEMRDVNDDTSLAPVLRVVMDPDFIEHDTYAIFIEVMEMVDPWYNSLGLEADRVKAKQQASLRKNMTRDPRTSRPFEENESSGPSSAIGRKLDVVHNVLLKKADKILYLHLKQLSIPAQTYGIRWIRLLFGREFPLPNVLEVWDALFADGPSLVDYMCVSMLMHIREVLIDGDYATCMHHLMHFPTVYEVNYLIQQSLHLRNPNVNPSPRMWSYHPHHKLHPSQPSHPPTSPHSQLTPPTNQQHTSRAKQAGTKAKQALSTAGKQLASGIKWREGGTEGRREGGSERREGTSPASSPPPGPPPLPNPGTTKESKKGRGRIIGEINEPKEMKKNPRLHPPAANSLGQVDRLISRVDDLEAKLAYCGAKMDSLLMVMEEEVSGLTEGTSPQLSPETENTLLLSVAGLKHVRDILLNKIAFSGALLQDEHMVTVHRQQDEAGGHQLDLAVQTPTSQVSQEPLSVTRGNGEPSEAPPSWNEDHPLLNSGEDWVHLSSSHGHPLVSSSDS